MSVSWSYASSSTELSSSKSKAQLLRSHSDSRDAMSHSFVKRSHRGGCQQCALQRDSCCYLLPHRRAFVQGGRAVFTKSYFPPDYKDSFVHLSSNASATATRLGVWSMGCGWVVDDVYRGGGLKLDDETVRVVRSRADPCGDIWINASKTPREAMPRAAWQACYESRATTLLGGYTMAGTSVYYNGSSAEFAVDQGCVCDCQGTPDGVVCTGTADGQGPYSLLAYLPEIQLAIAEFGDLGMLVFRGRQRSLGSHVNMNVYYRADLEWPDDLESEHLAIGEGALFRTEETEVVQWRARQTPSNCSLAAPCGGPTGLCAAAKLPSAGIGAKCPPQGW
eukprot:COSAG06_NODE_2762_length_6327_cov_5.664740_5_plen_335_part_00